MAVLLAISSIVSLAVARTLTAQGAVKDARAVSTELNSLLEEASTAPYLDLVGMNFNKPAACDDDITKSCIQVGPETLEVLWQVELGDDLAGNSLVAASDLKLTAITSLPGGREVESSRDVSAPVAGWKSNEGLVRVKNLGSDYSGSVFLLSADKTTVLDSRTFSDSDSVLLRSDPANCLPANPCVIALTEKGDGFNETHTLLAPDVLNGSNRVSLTANALTAVSIHPTQKASLSLDLSAGDTSSVQATPQAGSVCLWASVNSVNTPLCNTLNPTKLSLETIDAGGTPLALPAGETIRMSVDNPNGRCDQVAGMLGRNATGWAPAAVCTSWTWGTPEKITSEGGTQAFQNASIKLKSGVNTATAAWSGDQARPAAGFSGQETWSKPRNLQPCSDTSSCTPLTSAPELTACPGLHCSSNVSFLPRATSPISGSEKLFAVKVNSGANTFTLSTRDDDGDAYQAIIESIPTAGTLRFNGQPVAVGTPLGNFTGTGDIVFSFTAPTGSVNQTFGVRLNSAAGSRLVQVRLYDKVYPLTLKAVSSEVTQNKDSKISYRLTGTDGNPMASQSVTLTLPSAFTTGPMNVSTNASGVAEFIVNGKNVKAGSVNMTVASGTLSQSFPVKVKPELSVINGSFNAGVLTFTALDKANDPVAGKVLNVRLEGSSGVVRGVYSKLSSCTTGNDGICKIPVTLETGAATSGLKAVVSHGSLTNTINFTGGN